MPELEPVVNIWIVVIYFARISLIRKFMGTCLLLSLKGKVEVQPCQRTNLLKQQQLYNAKKY